MSYVSHRGGANAICDICGFQFKNFELKQNWKGQWVCKEDYETRHPQELMRPRAPEKPLPWTRPDLDQSVYGSLLPESLHTSMTTAVSETGAPIQVGIQFTISSFDTGDIRRYISGITLYHGGSSEHKRGQSDNDLLVQIWSDPAGFSPPKIAYSTRTGYLKPGWNYIPVVPNLQVTAGDPVYIVAVVKELGVQSHSYLSPTVATPARDKATITAFVKNSDPVIQPSDPYTDAIPLIDVVITDVII
jgi:hypothetical protein